MMRRVWGPVVALVALAAVAGCVDTRDDPTEQPTGTSQITEPVAPEASSPVPSSPVPSSQAPTPEKSASPEPAPPTRAPRQPAPSPVPPAPPPAPATSASPTPSPSPSVETRTVTETEEIPFDEETVADPTLPDGVEEVRVEGVPGELTLTYEVTLVDGEETDRRLVEEEVTEEPVTQVLAIGTKAEESGCDPNYSGCVPIASDVDCANGGGDGPAYVNDEVEVIGIDIYGLDRDGDGIACEWEEEEE